MKTRISKVFSTLDGIGEKISEEHLLKFDHRSILLVIFCVLIFSLAVAFKLHGSSISIWDKNLKEEDTGFILGKPRAIRSDEWLTQTPEIISQVEKDFPVENFSIGGEKAPLIRDYPVRHFVSLFKPHHWGFFFLDVERGFSWFWNFKTIGIFLSFFILFMLLTKNNFWLSVFGSFWVLFSNFIQWWFSINMSQMLVYFALMTVAAAYLFFSKNKFSIFLSAVVLFFSSLAFTFLFYPPFQIALAWLSLAILIGLFLRNRKNFKNLISLRVVLLGVVASVGIFTLLRFYGDARSTIYAAQNTSYPGHRISTGGDIFLSQYFSGFFGSFMSEKKFPKKLGNVCEASSFLFFFPLVIFAVGYNFLKKRKNDPVIGSLCSYLVFLSVYVLWEFPAPLTKISLFSLMPGTRAVLGLGVAGIMVAILFLGEKKDYAWINLQKKNLPYLFLTTGIFLFLINSSLGNFLKFSSLASSILIFTLIFYWFLKRKVRLFSVSVLAVVFYSTLSINPVSSGLSAIFEKDLYEKAQKEEQKNPGEKWLVFDSHKVADFLKSAEIDVLNGTKFPPDTAFMEKLSDKKDDKKIYNSFAHIGFERSDSEKALFERTQFDSYRVSINPCSEKIKGIGVKYVVFADPVEEGKYVCLSKLVFESGKVRAYQLP